MSNLEAYAKDELTRAGLFDKESDYDGMLGEAVMKMVKQFSEEGHSGASAARTLQLFGRVARFKPLRPLYGTNDEWMEVGEGEFQNRRSSSVFKKDGVAYDIDANNNRAPITFPYWPE